jgi:hypothetical protein
MVKKGPDYAAIAAAAMKGGDPWQKLIVYVCYAISASGGFALSLPPYETPKQLACLAFIIVPLLVAGCFVIVRYRHLLGDVKAPTPLVAAPSTPANIHLSSTTREKMFQVLEEARQLAWKLLNAKEPALRDTMVRANVFFPDYESAGTSRRKYFLKIKPGLHINMTEREAGITLEPGQGLTGHVFQTGEPRVAQRLTTEESGWDEVYKITPELAAIVHPELKWIVSMPLKYGEGRPIGVMNIDGLTHQCKLDDLYECSRKLTQSAIIMAGLALGN